MTRKPEHDQVSGLGNEAELKEAVTIQTLIDEMNDIGDEFLKGIELEKFNLCLASFKAAQAYADLPEKIEGMKCNGIFQEGIGRNKALNDILNLLKEGVRNGL